MLSGEDTFQCHLDSTVHGKVGWVVLAKLDGLPVHGTACNAITTLTLRTLTMNSNTTSTMDTQCMISLWWCGHWLGHAHQPSRNILTDDYEVPFTMLPTDLLHQNTTMCLGRQDWSYDLRSANCYSCSTDSCSMHTWYVGQAHLFSITSNLAMPLFPNSAPLFYICLHMSLFLFTTHLYSSIWCLHYTYIWLVFIH